MTTDKITWFDVVDGKTLCILDYDPPETRGEAFVIDEGSLETDLIGEVEACQPLAWHLVNHLDDPDDERVLPIEDDYELAAFLDQATPEQLKDITEEAKRWLKTPVEYGYGEEDYFRVPSDGQAFALEHFRDDHPEVAEQLGIDIIEGEGPSSTYYAAELSCTVDEANLKAEQAGLGVRFRDADKELH